MTVPERPSCYDDKINCLVAQALLPRVVRWLKDAGDSPDEAEVLEQLTEAVDLHDDGYAIAKALDRDHMWEVDSSLVDVLDDASHCRYQAHETLVQEWVGQHGVRPGFSVGQRVAFKQQRWDKEAVTGEVTAVREKTAQYLVFCESLGHVRTGNGTHGTYVPYEACSAA